MERSCRRIQSPRNRIAPRDLVLNLSLKCPLRCEHCCFRSDMSQTACMALPEVRKAIDEAAQIASITSVHFVGGDPFLLPDLMLDGIGIAASHGMGSAATTSAFFGKSEERAYAILQPMVAAGLEEITISYDDMHAAFVKEHFILNTVQAARRLGLPFRVAVTISPPARIDAAYMRALLGIPEDKVAEKVYQVLVNSTGRAADGKSEEGPVARAGTSDDHAYRGPCHSVLQSFQVTDSGRILPCCGVLPYTDRMSIGQLGQVDLAAAIRESYRDPLLKWIAFEGPVALLAQVTAQDPEPITPASLDGICTACDRLFNDEVLYRRSLDALRDKAESLAAHEVVLTAVGQFAPPLEECSRPAPLEAAAE